MASAALVAAMGAASGGGVTFLGAVGMAVGGAVGGIIDQSLIPQLFREKKGPTQFGDIPVQGFTEGEPLAECWGAYCMVPGQLIFAGVPDQESRAGNTKRGQPAQTTTYRTVAWAFTHGRPVHDTINPQGFGFRELYADGLFVYDGSLSLEKSGIIDSQVTVRFDDLTVRRVYQTPYIWTYEATKWTFRIETMSDANGDAVHGAPNLGDYRVGEWLDVAVTVNGSPEYSLLRDVNGFPQTPVGDQNRQTPWRVVNSGRLPGGNSFVELDLRDYFPVMKPESNGSPRAWNDPGLPPFTHPFPPGSTITVTPQYRRRWRSGMFYDEANDVQFFRGFEHQSVQPFSSLLQADKDTEFHEVTRLPEVSYFVGRRLNLSTTGNKVPNMSAWMNFVDGLYNGGNETTERFVYDVLTRRCSLPDARVDVTALETYRTDNPDHDFGWLDGYVSIGTQTGAEVLRPVALTKEVYFQEHDGKVIAKHTPQRAWFRVTHDDVIVADYNEPPISTVELGEVNEAELAQHLSLIFRSIDDLLEERQETADDDALQTWQRAKIHRQIDAGGVSVTRHEAKATINRALMTARARRYSVRIPLTRKFENVVPEDLLIFPDMMRDGEIWPILVTKVELGIDESVQIEGFAVIEDGNAENLEIVASLTGTTTTNQTVFDPTAENENRFGSGRPETLFSRRDRLWLGEGLTLLPIDIGPFHDDHALTPGYYVAAAPISEDRELNPNGELWLKRPSEPDYAIVGPLNQPSAIGRAEGVLGTANPAIFAPRSAIRVHLPTDVQLESATIDELYEGANRMLIGGELVAFQTATAVSPGVWDLKGMLRGLHSTNDEVDKHQIQEPVVWLGHRADAPWNLIRVPINEYDLGATHLLKAVPAGEVMADVHPVSHNVLSRNNMPPPVAEKCARRLPNGDIEISWIPQSRRVPYGGQTGKPNGVCDCPGRFKVTIAEAPDREWITEHSKVIYTVAQQTADGTNGSTVTASVAALTVADREGVAVVVEV